MGQNPQLSAREVLRGGETEFGVPFSPLIFAIDNKSTCVIVVDLAKAPPVEPTERTTMATVKDKTVALKKRG